MSQSGERTEVLYLTFEVTQQDFEHIQQTLRKWFTQQQQFLYNFPDVDGTFEANQYNCAIFPKLLGLKLPSEDGNLAVIWQYILKPCDRQGRKDGKRIIGAFSKNPVYDELLYTLNRLAGQWRREKSDDLIRRYQAVYRTLLELGFDEELDVESELPDDFMPAEYFRRYGQVEQQ